MHCPENVLRKEEKVMDLNYVIKLINNRERYGKPRPCLNPLKETMEILQELGLPYLLVKISFSCQKPVHKAICTFLTVVPEIGEMHFRQKKHAFCGSGKKGSLLVLDISKIMWT